jgi:hypothetical protein
VSRQLPEGEEIVLFCSLGLGWGRMLRIMWLAVPFVNKLSREG